MHHRRIRVLFVNFVFLEHAGTKVLKNPIVFTVIHTHTQSRSKLSVQSIAFNQKYTSTLPRLARTCLIFFAKKKLQYYELKSMFFYVLLFSLFVDIDCRREEQLVGRDRHNELVGGGFFACWRRGDLASQPIAQIVVIV